MSEVYKFKSLSEVETLAEPGDGTTVLAVENGAVKQIPSGKFGGGGAGNFIVNVVPDLGDGSASGDKTFAEMVAAIESGALPVAAVDLSALVGGIFFVMITMYNPEAGIGFMLDINGTALQVLCGPDNTWQVQMPG